MKTGGGPLARIPVPQPWRPSVPPICPGYLATAKLHKKSNRGAFALATKSIMGTVIIGWAWAAFGPMTNESTSAAGVGSSYAKLRKKKSLPVLSTFCCQLYRLVRFPP